MRGPLTALSAWDAAPGAATEHGVCRPPDGARFFAAGASASYQRHLAAYGPLPRYPDGAFLAVLEESGLTGRGGAGFATWRKFATVHAAVTGFQPPFGPGSQFLGRSQNQAAAATPVLIANGAEGEPLSVKDATLLHNAPHLVIDGLLAAARLLGATDLVIYTGGSTMTPVTAALAQRNDAAAIVPVPAPPGFLSGQATAAVSFLGTGRAVPRDLERPLAEAGLRGRPTLVHNVETWADVALLARYGASWFRSAGTATDPGTRLVSLSGNVPAPVVLEIPGGAVLADVLGAAGIRPEEVGAVLVGGYSGRWIRNLGVRLSPPGSAGEPAVHPGAGVLHVLGRDRCGLSATAAMVDYLAGQSARQCGPCRFGLPDLSTMLGRLAAATGGPDLLSEVERLGKLVNGRGACHHPDGTVQLIRSGLAAFADDIPWHLAGRCRHEPGGQGAGGWGTGGRSTNAPGGTGEPAEGLP